MITTPILQNPTLAVSWVGHATVLIQIHDKIIVTDPFFTNTMGFVAKRFVGPGLDPALLTRVDATLISHIHFDHFDYGSIDKLPKNGILAVPKGACRILRWQSPGLDTQPYSSRFTIRSLLPIRFSPTPWVLLRKDLSGRVSIRLF